MTARSRAHSLVGSNPKGRPADDFYPTPPDAVAGLLKVEKFDSLIWEPACGEGHISQYLDPRGYSVISTDKYDHGYGTSGIDFLDTAIPRSLTIITNPPFKLAEQFVAHAMSLGIEKMALLLKLAALEGVSRSTLFENTPLKKVWVSRRRIKMTRNGQPMKNGGMIAFAWFVWEVSTLPGEPRIGWF